MPIIPLPTSIDPSRGVFTLSAETAILADVANQWNAAYLRDLFQRATGYPLPLLESESSPQPVIHLISRPHPELGREGYLLTATPEEVRIEADNAVGVFYGIQSLRQLLPVEIEQRAVATNVPWQIPCLVIADKPRFAWRGHMLDVSRHFQPKEVILRTLDLMALQKLNVLHWHVNDDQGWRVEIQQASRLTEVGSWRKGTKLGLFGKDDGIPHGGFYTQADIREIVEYAARRNITIAPELETPGHAMAALSAYPQVSCTGGPFQVRRGPGITRDLFCAGKEETFTFLQTVLDELIDLFPSPFIHIGGDEAPKMRWKACPDCQRRMRQLGLNSAHELQGYFTNRLVAHLEHHNRRAVIWSDGFAPGLAESVVVQHWIRNRKQLAAEVDKGRDLIVSTHGRTYLDQSYSYISLRKAYEFDPVFPEVADPESSHILGVEAPLWSEWVPTPARMDYQVYPRLTAIAERGWTMKQHSNYADFRQRLAGFLRRLDLLGVKYAPLDAVDPSWIKQKLGLFTVIQPKNRVRE
jgi:hexosaminidase